MCTQSSIAPQSRGHEFGRFGSFATGRGTTGGRGMSASLRKRTCVSLLDMSALCQKQTFDGYSINSLAPMVMPSALAVLRFRNSSTFVACWTGVVLPPPDKRTHAVRQDRRLVEIHLFRQGDHQHRDLGHVLGGHDVIVAGLLTVAGLGPPAPRRERRQRG